MSILELGGDQLAMMKEDQGAEKLLMEVIHGPLKSSRRVMVEQVDICKHMFQTLYKA